MRPVLCPLAIVIVFSGCGGEGERGGRVEDSLASAEAPPAWAGDFHVVGDPTHRLEVFPRAVSWTQPLRSYGLVTCRVQLAATREVAPTFGNLSWQCPQSLTPSKKNSLRYSAEADTWLLTDGEGRIADQFLFRRARVGTAGGEAAGDGGERLALRQRGVEAMPANAYGRFGSTGIILHVDRDGIHRVDTGEEDPVLKALLTREYGPSRDIKTTCRYEGPVRRHTPDAVTIATVILRGVLYCEASTGSQDQYNIELQYVPDVDAWVEFYESRPGEKWMYGRRSPSTVPDTGANRIALSSTGAADDRAGQCRGPLRASVDSLLVARFCGAAFGLALDGDTVVGQASWLIYGKPDSVAFSAQEYRKGAVRYVAILSVTGPGPADDTRPSAVRARVAVPEDGEIGSGQYHRCTRGRGAEPYLVVLLGPEAASGARDVLKAWEVQPGSGALRPALHSGISCLGQ